jgi:sarcosine oxidase
LALKIGGSLRDSESVEQAALTEWFHGDGNPTEVKALQNSLTGLLPGIEVRSWAQKPCVVTNTATDHPYVGWVDDGIAVALGGCGAAAKSSDELGRLASTLFESANWTDTLPAAAFEPVFD